MKQPTVCQECKTQLETESPVLAITNLSKSFTLHSVNKEISGCQDISLEVPRGSFVGITGKSGSGKSTILRCIYRTNLPQTGQILYDSDRFGQVDLTTISERDMNYLRKKEIGYVSQFLQVLPRITCFDLVYRAALIDHEPAVAKEKTIEMLRHFELSESLWSLYPKTFSGGEKLRLNIACAMVKTPKLLLLDEPTASLDAHSKEKVRDLIWQLKEAGTTMLGIFHDLEFMDGLCDTEFNIQEGMFI